MGLRERRQFRCRGWRDFGKNRGAGFFQGEHAQTVTYFTAKA
jgi:hypothetical protein